MKSVNVLFVVLATLFCVGILGKKVVAQNYRTDGGLLVMEDDLLLLKKKQVVFVVAKNISSPARVEFQTISSEGIINRFTPLNFPQGLKRGQVIPIWSGELNSFLTTPWLYFQVTIFTATDAYFSQTMSPVGYREQYKEPMITSISESGGFTIPYTITVRGIFDTTIPSLVLINSDVFVSPKVVTQGPAGVIQFSIAQNTAEQFPPGKYLLTICQAGHCDTLMGRHR